MRKSEPSKTVNLNVGIWLNQDTGAIHMAAKGAAGFITTINGDGGRKRGHPNLFKKLANCLKIAGAPYPEIPED